jgi:cell division protease FtsH
MDIACAMMTRGGMSEKLGHVALERQLNAFSRQGPAQQDFLYGDATVDSIDAEVQQMIGMCFRRVEALLTSLWPVLEDNARPLLARDMLYTAVLSEFAPRMRPVVGGRAAA